MSLSGALFGPLFGTTATAATTSDAAWISALCEVEAALTRACVATGLVSRGAAHDVITACNEMASYDPVSLGQATLGGGNPLIPLVGLLRSRVTETAGAEVARAVHLGATSQDIVDTAEMLLTRRTLDVILPDLAACEAAAAELAATFRTTPMVARTLMQQALPTTFGAVAAAWGTTLDDAAIRMRAVRDSLPVSLGGPAGTLDGWYPHGFEVRDALAADLGLAVGRDVWHTNRAIIIDIAAACGTTSAAVMKVATDITLLAQSEVGEVREAKPGKASSMLHKNNPITAITARAAAAQVPGLVATMVMLASHELQRAGGSWHAEWPPITALLRATGGAADRLRASLSGLAVDTKAMARNLDALLDATGSEPSTGHAADLVDRYLSGRAQ